MMPIETSRGLHGNRNTGMESMLAPDLQDWLRLTGWHDIDYREKKLAEYRNNYTQEQNHDMGRGKAAINILKKDPDSFASISRGSSLQPGRAAEPEGSKDNKGSKGNADMRREVRGRDIIDLAARNRSVSPLCMHRRERDEYSIRDYPKLYHKDDDEPLTPGGTPLCTVRPSTHPAQQAGKAEIYDGPNRERAEDQRDLMREMAHLRSPKKLTLGGKGEICFFVMRSYSWAHVYDSMEDGVWATQRPNAEVLSEAFTSGKTVLLFFSVNKSHGIQGYALMKSRPSVAIHHPKWWYGVKWSISEPFQVEWINTMHIDSKHVYHISNRLNEDLPVTRARNGQEIDEDSGRQMVSILESRAVEHYRRAKRIGTLSG
ncbi:YTH-domain-containing protein [Daldinia sp. FL1419]|nr:YTH-domain-containing protein [Daldinia sp. FL1419]